MSLLSGFASHFAVWFVYYNVVFGTLKTLNSYAGWVISIYLCII